MNVQETPLFPIYLHRLFGLAQAIRDDCDWLFRETQPLSAGHYFKISSEVHSRIEGILVGAANVKKLIQTSQARGAKESDAAYCLRKDRAKVLMAILDGMELDEFLNTQTRNSLEHFDEYLDDQNVRLAKGESPPASVAAYNLVMSDWQMMEPRPFAIHVYVAAERKYYNMGREIDLGRLRNQAAALLVRLTGHPFFRGVTEPGGLLLKLCD